MGCLTAPEDIGDLADVVVIAGDDAAECAVDGCAASEPGSTVEEVIGSATSELGGTVEATGDTAAALMDLNGRSSWASRPVASDAGVSASGGCCRKP